MTPDGMTPVEVQTRQDGEVGGGFVAAPALSSRRPDRLPGVRYSIDCSAAFGGASGAAISSAELGKNSGLAAALPRESLSPRSLNPWPGAC